MEFEGSFGLAQEFFSLVSNGKIALKAAFIDFSEVGFPFDDARDVDSKKSLSEGIVLICPLEGVKKMERVEGIEPS